MTVRITGTGSYLPERVMTNAELEAIVDTSDEWIVTRTGIKERRIAADDEASSDMAAAAARPAMEAAGVSADDVDMIVVATTTPDMLFPSSACVVQGLLGAKNAFCFDLSAACSGFLYALEVARCSLESGSSETALVIGAEKFSSILDWEDRNTCVLFGDGAGAVVIRKSDDGRGIIAGSLEADGTCADMLNVPGGGSRLPFSKEVLEQRQCYVKMNGREVFKRAVRSMADVSARVLESAGLSTDDIDCVIPHQANLRIIEAVASRLDIPLDKFYLNLSKVGNVSAASVPLAMDEASRSGALKRGDLVLVSVMGAGFTWGASVLEW